LSRRADPHEKSASMTAVSITKAAELFSWSRRVGAPIRTLPADLLPKTLEQAYDIQIATFRLRGMGTAGFKIGLTNVEAQRSSGAAAPIAGRLASADILRSPARIALSHDHLRIVEAEVVFEVGCTILANDGPLSDADLHHCLRGAYAGIEICNSRLSASDDAPLPAIVADNSNADRLVIGERLPHWSIEALADLRVTLTRSGQPAIDGTSRRVLGQPVKALTWLVNWLGTRGEGLKAGDLIASGSCTGMTEVAPGDSVVATFDGGARVAVDFTEVETKSGARA
jgi:2-keto-4-pentenoate hydratase